MGYVGPALSAAGKMAQRGRRHISCDSVADRERREAERQSNQRGLETLAIASSPSPPGPPVAVKIRRDLSLRLSRNEGLQQPV
jgi:hypothetical protein